MTIVPASGTAPEDQFPATLKTPLAPPIHDATFDVVSQFTQVVCTDFVPAKTVAPSDAFESLTVTPETSCPSAGTASRHCVPADDDLSVIRRSSPLTPLSVSDAISYFAPAANVNSIGTVATHETSDAVKPCAPNETLPEGLVNLRRGIVAAPKSSVRSPAVVTRISPFAGVIVPPVKSQSPKR